MIGTAASAGLAGRLMNDDARPLHREPDRGGKSGKSGADDVDGSRHQTNAYCA